jgi:hypothetical protein
MCPKCSYCVDMASTSDTTTVRLPRELVEQVRELAQLHHRSLSGELRVALLEYIHSCEGRDR